ncbi:MAG: hydrogenase [Clostridiales Family XIII bacterium]|jgi:nitrogenase molybdenum-iron protein beta chain|nr:hydrogenase [Clostridiales Family XIII bacterium]
MLDVIQEPRHACALGAQQTVVSIERAIPIIHAGPGCGSKLHRGMSQAGGYQGVSYAGADAIPSSNLIEKDVVFGGTDKLRNLIEGTLKVMDGDFFVVFTSCVSEIIGDDVGNVVGEFRSKGIPIVYAETAGFKGDAYLGHELVLQSIIEQHLQPAEKKRKGFVNIFSSVPRHDPFWEGDLNELRRLLAAVGLDANILFGFSGGGIKAVEAIPSAEFNLVISPYLGLQAAQLLEEKFGTPYLHYPVLPVGGVETSKFLRAVGEYAKLSPALIESVVAEKENEFYHYMVRAADLLTEFQTELPKSFYIINDAAYTLGISKFLVNDLGHMPLHQYITEDVPEEHREPIRGYFAELAPGISSEITFTQDGGLINEDIVRRHKGRRPLLLGSSWEIDLAKEINGLHLSVGIPVIDRLILHHSYLGYAGGLNLMEDIYGRVLSASRGY